ncbi:LCP family protein [Saccharibacillus sp. CPCC 101409]|uniref:LCP family protein n=1 Tax=Saccharibacillus sp. CPCC 101409 TaxID=3058041 RepID=UPI002671D972|nr:LCP family protein [Saccharibacillus sp. CPCC 101409]MDO3409191.1 LCP family protein [Saccharibacillus sp. CPCC 101409]
MSSTRGGGLPPRSGGGRGASRAGSGEVRRAQASAPQRPPAGGGGRKSGAKRKKSGAKRFWTIFAIVLVLLIIGIGAYLGWVYQKSKAIGTAGEPAKSAASQPIAMALLGTDFRQETGTNLTDVVMVAAMNPDTDTATVVSIPRDSQILLDGYKVRKINAYYPHFLAEQKKGGEDAKEEMKTMLGKYFNTPLDYVTVVNFNTLKDVVDALGGVEVDVDMDMCYKTQADNTNIDLKKGLQTLDGEEALGYARYRHTTNTITMDGKDLCADNKTKESSDIERNKRQQQLIGSVLDKLKSFNAITKSGALIEAVADNTDTDIENKQVMNLARTYWNLPKENIKFMQVTGPWDRKTGFVYLKDDELAAAKQALQDEMAGKHKAGTDAGGNN